MTEEQASPTFLLTHRFHALSDSLIRSGGEGCLEFLKEFHALDVVVVAVDFVVVVVDVVVVVIWKPGNMHDGEKCTESVV